MRGVAAPPGLPPADFGKRQIRFNFSESLILAQNERWRRG